ncbi:MAG: IPT/TIG domain-containing protein, partial [Methanomicrobiales archaeon]|nr:IPT/TIG domain-containing protein [Methanomicrobiales archaeon]
VTGTNYNSGSIVRWNGVDRTTTYVSGTQLTASILASDIGAAGTATVTVYNPDSGLTSNSKTFTVTGDIPRPIITSLAPSSAVAGSPAFTLTVTGQYFTRDSRVRWDGSDRETGFTISGDLVAQIAASDVVQAGYHVIIVYDPAGGTSDPVTFPVLNPVPILSTLNPNKATAGGPPFTLTISGQNFVAGSTVRWDGGVRAMTYVSEVEIRTQVSDLDIANPGDHTVTVFNDPPGGGESTPLTFHAVTVGQPQITSLSPPTVTAGGPPFILTVYGQYFTAESDVWWDGTPRDTGYLSASQITTSIPASDITTPGGHTITVYDPVGGASNQWPFNVTRSVTVVSLSQGWNFVSTPRLLAEGHRTAFEVFGSVNVSGHSIWRYDPLHGWDYYRKGDEVKPLDGIWVYSATATSLDLVFDTESIPMPPSRHLMPGWNAIGFAGTTPTSARDTLLSLGEKWVTAIGFIQGTQSDYPIIRGSTNPLYSDSRLMTPTKGYWLSTTGEGDLVGMI